MKRLREGQYFGNSNFKVSFDGISITDTEYTHDYVDWHGHENPYFTFLLQGKLIEENKKETYCLSQGSLLFHNWQDF
ncbi:MAG: AraC family transcriptional regulator, partial [Flavobacteriaceae bacterium]